VLHHSFFALIHRVFLFITIRGKLIVMNIFGQGAVFMKLYKIAVIPGDGVGPEVLAEGVKVLRKVGN
jgi:hypothetical protein